MKEFRNASGLEFKDISTESMRIYTFKGIRIKIKKPLKIHINPKSGGHRIFAEDGKCYYIPSGWVCLIWKTKKGESHFSF